MAEIKKAKVKQSNITQAVDLLQDLPRKVKEEHSLREAVKAMYPTIRGVLKKGYNYSEVATMLNQADITISGTTLRQYVQEIVKQHKKPNQPTQKDDRGKLAEVVLPSQSIDSDAVTPTQAVVPAADVVLNNAEVETDPDADLDLEKDVQQNLTNPNTATEIKAKKLRQSGQSSRSNIADEFNNY